MTQVQSSLNFSLKHKLKTQNNFSRKIVKINSGVIFIDEDNNSKYERKEGKTYWFHKYLQDLQNIGISQKIVNHF